MNEGRCDERLKTRVEESKCVLLAGVRDFFRLVQEAFWRGGVAFVCFSRENNKEAHMWL
jgi:hypothetical protein